MKIKQILTSNGGEIKLVVSDDGRVFELVGNGDNPAGTWVEYKLGEEIENDIK